MHGPIFDSRRLHHNCVETAEDSRTDEGRCPSGDQRRELLEAIPALADELQRVFRERGLAVLPVVQNCDPVAALRQDVEAWRQRLRCWAQAHRARRKGFVYLVQFRGARGTPVKIGRTTSLDGRLADLQRMSPFPLELVALIHGADREARLHEQWAEHRLHGEWFDGAALDGWIQETQGRPKCEACWRIAWLRDQGDDDAI